MKLAKRGRALLLQGKRAGIAEHGGASLMRCGSAWLLVLMLMLMLSLAAVPGALAQAAPAADRAPAADQAHGAGHGERGGGRQSTPAAQSKDARQGVADENAEYRDSAVVKKLGSMLGMSTERAATTFEVFNFAVLAVLIGYLLLKILPKTFRDRTSRIQRHLVDARTATEEASARMNSIEDRLAKLDGQISAMSEQADRDSVADEQRIKASIEEERVKILAAADQEIGAATTQAQRQLQQYAAELAVEQAGRKLIVTAEMDRLLVQGFARRLGADGSKGGEN